MQAEGLLILQRIVDTLLQRDRKNSIERECYLVSLIGRLEGIVGGGDERRKVEVVKRLIEVILRGGEQDKINILLCMISNMF
ncbi:hypothetical protein NEAUS06_2115 [Nematocida ausubeli]|nr:hypothetical protein NEAUS06_2105 [Nematocida ausubeli]KAI5137150.1 hypothetical protein NEAUS06_2115 [Nematocida ausubeli]